MNCNFGILNINKPKGITSHDVVARLRKILNMKQIGHTGTLDPIAQGVLPICVGKATRLIEYLPTGKAYRAYAKLGIKTNTYDIEGEILETKPVKVGEEKIKEALKTFEGKIEQTPPAFSAIKLKGKKLYEYARKGEEVEIPKRQVTINKIKLLEIKEDNIIVFDVDCSGGTYIRSIISDLGEKLGCGAMMIDLVRTKSGGFTLDSTITLEEVEPSKIINPIDKINLPKLSINDEQLSEIKLGRQIKSQVTNGKLILEHQGQVAAIANCENNTISPKKVF